IRSLTIAPLAVQESCASFAPGTTTPPVTWDHRAWACDGTASGICVSGEVCAVNAPASGFSECVFDYGDRDCPSAGVYTNKHLFYATANDTRGCSTCICGPPAGSMCSALVSVWSDGSCSTPLASDVVDSNTSICVDLIPGSALGSKSLGAATYTPGT